MHQTFRSAIAIVAVYAATTSAGAQTISLENVAEKLGAKNIDAIEYSGVGKWYRFGQGPVLTAGWQQNDVLSYTTIMNFKASAAHTVMARTETPADPQAAPNDPDQVNESVSGSFAWRIQGNNVQAQPAFRNDRWIDIWASPQAFIKAAITHAAVFSLVGGGADVTFSLEGQKFVGRINSRQEVESVRTWLPNPVFGDMEVSYSYSDYRDFGGLQFPSRLVRSQGGYPVWDLSVKAVKANPNVAIPVPQPVQNYKMPPARVDTLKIADGVFVFRGGMYNSVAVEQSDRVVLVEAPLDEDRSLAVIDRIKSLIPGKPIKYVINTHAHLDHSGGLRTFAAQDAVILTDRDNRTFFENAWKAPHNIKPDRLSKAGKKVRLETMTGRYVLSDTLRSVEIYPVIDSAHVDAKSPKDGLRMVYLPKEKFLIQADGFSPAPGNQPPPATPDPDNLNLYNNIKLLGKEILLLVPLHGEMAHMSDLLQAVGKDELPEGSNSGCKQEIFYC